MERKEKWLQTTTTWQIATVAFAQCARINRQISTIQVNKLLVLLVAMHFFSDWSCIVNVFHLLPSLYLYLYLFPIFEPILISFVRLYIADWSFFDHTNAAGPKYEKFIAINVIADIRRFPVAWHRRSTAAVTTIAWHVMHTSDIFIEAHTNKQKIVYKKLA